jgi:hypothetical protein
MSRSHYRKEEMKQIKQTTAVKSAALIKVLMFGLVIQSRMYHAEKEFIVITTNECTVISDLIEE